MITEHVYGIDFVLPPQPAPKDILNVKLEKKKQKWYRAELPAFFDNLEFDDEGEPIYTDQMLEFIEQELDRIYYGVWLYINGKPTYITGLHYFYLQYWMLENGEAPEYRAADRRYFYFQLHCEGLPWVDGIIRSKKRREGATSQATADLVKTAITIKKALCGIVSKGLTDAKTAFINMIRPAFQQLPVYLKPQTEDEESKSELYMVRKKRSSLKKRTKKKGQVKDDDLGLGSKIDYRATALNSYDSGRLTKVLVEEGGKWPAEVPVDEYWDIVRQTLKQGARKVGFALLPSTSNKMEKGGKGFKTLWDNSNQFIRKVTSTGLYRYFSPAEEGYAPFIDEYGESITLKPTREQAKWMKEFYGATDEQCSMSAREWILYERSLITDENKRKEHERMYPLNEKEAFDFADSDNIYDMEAIADQRQALRDNPVPMRQGTFYQKDDGTVEFKESSAGMWWIEQDVPPDLKNNQHEINGKKKPGNSHQFVLVADPFKNTIVRGKGSMGAAIVGSKLNPLDPDNTGKPMAYFHGRPKLRRDFNKQMLYAAIYYGCEMCYESDFDEYLEFLDGEKMRGYAQEKPKNVVDPNRKKRNKNQKEYGIKSADNFAYSMMIDCSQAYVMNYCWKINFDPMLEDLEEYEESERTLHDLAVALQLFTVAIAAPITRKKEEKTKPVRAIRTFRVNVA